MRSYCVGRADNIASPERGRLSPAGRDVGASRAGGVYIRVESKEWRVELLSR